MIRQIDGWAEGQIYGNKLINTNGYFNHVTYIYLLNTDKDHILPGSALVQGYVYRISPCSPGVTTRYFIL